MNIIQSCGLLAMSVTLSACLAGGPSTPGGPGPIVFPANYQPYHDGLNAHQTAAWSGTNTDLGTPTGTATFNGFYYFDDDNYVRYISDMALGVDFDNSNTVTASITGSTNQNGKQYTGTINVAGISATVNNGGTSFTSGGTITGSMTSGADTLSFSGTALPNGTFHSNDSSDYLAGNLLGSGATISIDGAAAIVPQQTGFGLLRQ